MANAELKNHHSYVTWSSKVDGMDFIPSKAVSDFYITEYVYHWFRRCPKSAWLFAYNSDKPKEVTLKRCYADSDVLTVAAQELFGEEKWCATDSENCLEAMLARTHCAIEEGCRVVENATFLVDQFVCVVDLLVLDEDKTTACTFAGGIDHGIYDKLEYALYNQWVLRKAGFPDVESKFIFVNGGWYLDEKNDRSYLLDMEPISKYDQDGSKDKDTEASIESLLETIRFEQEPTVQLGDQCRFVEHCEWQSLCWKDEPKPSTYDLNMVFHPQCERLYQSGIKTFEQYIKTKPRLTPAQVLQIFCETTEVEEVVDYGKIQSFLSKLERSIMAERVPLCFLQFECRTQVIPSYLGQETFDYYPTEYSLWTLHPKGTGSVLDDYQEPEISYKESDGRELEKSTNPLRDMASSLVEDIPKDAHVIVWDDLRERDALRRLERGFSGGRTYRRPDLRRPPYGIDEDCENRLGEIILSLKSLAEPFQNRWYYNKKMEGWANKKGVLASLCPEYEPAYCGLKEKCYEMVQIYQALRSLTWW